MSILLALLAPALPAPVQQTFAEPRRLMPRLGLFDGAAAVGDLDGDGHADALFVTSGADHLLLGGATTAFTNASASLPDFGADNVDVAVGDLDGDGDDDAAVGSLAAPTAVFLSSGGELTPHATLGSGLLVRDVELGDLDGDGDLDLVVVSEASFEIEVFANDGAAGFTLVPGAVPPQVQSATSAVAIGDLDGDGSADLYLAKPTSFDRVLLGSSTLTFIEAPGAPLSFASELVQAGDADGDGVDEVVAATSNGLLWLVQSLGGGAFGFGPLVPPSAGAFQPTALAFEDFDGNGADDVFVAAAAPQLYLSFGASGFLDASSQLPPYSARVVAIGDLDADQDIDVMLQDATPALLLRWSAGFHDVHPHFGMPIWLGPSADAGDVDGDGDDDVVGSSSVFFSDGAGGLIEGGDVPLTSTRIELIDLDGDGDLDTLVSGSQSLRLAANDGAGGFSDAGPVGDLASIFTAVAGDLDGDGDADVVAGRNVGLALVLGLPLAEVRLNDGAGAFPTAGFLDAQLEINDPHLVDLDLDGDLDLLFAGGESGAQVNDGTGAFAASGLVPPGLSSGFAGVGDVDADGDPDAVFGGLAGDLLFVNDGTGQLWPAPPGQLPSTPGQTGLPKLVDADGDGVLDLIVLGKSHLYYAGLGAGAFAAPEVFATEANGSAAVLDLDLDGDLDVVGGGFDTIGGWIHVAGGQTARHTPPRIGKPLEMLTFGAPGASYLLAVAPFAASIPLGAYGTLALDPATVKVVASGTIPSDGRAADVIAVPSVQPLVGVAIHWQSLVGAPGTFTTPEATTLTAD